MRLWGLDNNFNLVAELKAINIQWQRKYYEYGYAIIQLPIASYDPSIEYIWKTDTGEVMDIEIRRYTTEGHGSFMYIEGYFVESWLSRGVILEPAKLPVSLPANIVSAVRSTIQSRVINDLPGMSSLIQLGTYESTAQTTEGCDENEFEVGLIAQQLLKSLDMSQRLRFNYDTKKFYYDIWKGKDRTQEGADQVLFSDSIGNINDVEYEQDTTDLKNFAHIRIDRGEDRVITDTYNIAGDGEPLRKMMVQFSDTESETDAQAKEAGKQQAKLDLLNHTRITNVSFEPANKAFEYLKDYDLGDRVNLTIDKISQTYAFRIIEVDEVYTNNTREIKLQFGDSKKLNYKKGRW